MALNQAVVDDFTFTISVYDDLMAMPGFYGSDVAAFRLTYSDVTCAYLGPLPRIAPGEFRALPILVMGKGMTGGYLPASPRGHATR